MFNHLLNDELTIERRYQTIPIEVFIDGELICKGTATQEKGGEGCPCGAEKIYAKGICINCYQKARRANA